MILQLSIWAFIAAFPFFISAAITQVNEHLEANFKGLLVIDMDGIQDNYTLSHVEILKAGNEKYDHIYLPFPFYTQFKHESASILEYRDKKIFLHDLPLQFNDASLRIAFWDGSPHRLFEFTTSKIKIIPALGAYSEESVLKNYDIATITNPPYISNDNYYLPYHISGNSTVKQGRLVICKNKEEFCVSSDQFCKTNDQCTIDYNIEYKFRGDLNAVLISSSVPFEKLIGSRAFVIMQLSDETYRFATSREISIKPLVTCEMCAPRLIYWNIESYETLTDLTVHVYKGDKLATDFFRVGVCDGTVRNDNDICAIEPKAWGTIETFTNSLILIKSTAPEKKFLFKFSASKVIKSGSEPFEIVIGYISIDLDTRICMDSTSTLSKSPSAQNKNLSKISNGTNIENASPDAIFED